jgi:hypothetical protein
MMRRQLCSQLSYLVRDAKKRAKDRHMTVTKVLMQTQTFFFTEMLSNLTTKVIKFL